MAGGVSGAEPERAKQEIEDVIGLEAQDAPLISAKNGLNIEEVLEQIVTKIPAPKGDASAPLKALIFDSLYDPYKGVIIFCRIMEGTVKKGTNIRMMATGAVEEVVEVGYFGAGQFIPCEELSAGMVGYITASIKNVKDTAVGDTVTDDDNPCAEPLPGYKKVQSMVYCGMYPADGAKYPDLRDALEKTGLPKESAKKYCFHAWRHFFASYMRDKVSEKLLQSQTGHKTLAMLEHYSNHKITGDEERIRQAQIGLFGGIVSASTITLDEKRLYQNVRVEHMDKSGLYEHGRAERKP